MQSLRSVLGLRKEREQLVLQIPRARIISLEIGDKKGKPRGQGHRRRHRIMAGVKDNQLVVHATGRARRRAVKSRPKQRNSQSTTVGRVPLVYHGIAKVPRRRTSLGQRPLAVARRHSPAPAPTHSFRELPIACIKLPHIHHRDRRHRV